MHGAAEDVSSHIQHTCELQSLLMQDGKFRAVGAPTEAALLVLTEKLGVAAAKQQQQIAAQRKRDPDAHPCGAVDSYNKRCAASGLIFGYQRCMPSCIVARECQNVVICHRTSSLMVSAHGCRLQTLATLEFDRNRKSMSTIARRGSGGKTILLVKVLSMQMRGTRLVNEWIVV